MSPPAVSLAVFDLGNVVFRCDPMATCRAWARRSGADPADLARRHPMNPRWEDFERGRLSGTEYWRYVNAALGLSLTWEEFVEGWNAIYFEVFPEVAVALGQLRPRLPAVALTNTNAVHCQAWQPRYAPVLALFQRVFISSEMGLRKPEPAIYRAVLQEMAAPAAATLFFDDSAENVAAARAVGLDAVLVGGPADVTRALRTRGLL